MNANFEFASEFASDYELSVCTFGDLSEAVGGNELSIEAIKILGTNEFAIPFNGYASALTLTFNVCKIRDCEIIPLSAEEYSKINRWLNRQEPHKFRTSTDSFERIFYIGTFNVAPVFINGLIYGAELTFTSIYPYGFQDEIVNEFSNVTDFDVICFSDEIGDTYPYVIITCNEPGDLTITNSLDNEIFVLNNVVAEEVITIDNKHKIITSSEDTHEIYSNFNFNFLKLCNTYKDRRNVYNSTLDINITFKYNPIRKVGIY